MDMDGAQPLKRRAWEVFCAAATGWAGGDPLTATDAYMQAYPRTRSRDAARGNAARLAARAEIKERCAWMRKQLAEAGRMDAANIRAKIVDLRLEIIDKTRATANKKLALEAARDLDRMFGFKDVVADAAGVVEAVQGELGNSGKAIESITLNLAKLMAGE